MIRILDERIAIPKELVLIPTFAILTALGAKVRLPLGFTPVPVTLQVLFVLLSGSFRHGYLSQLLYLSLGIAGVPLFSLGGGVGYLFGPTGGYLLAFPLASILINIFVERRWSFYIASFCAVAIIYFIGTAQLANYLALPYLKALQLGALPFIPYDIIKSIIAARLMVEISK
ncbi:MAG TPA: biotin transporter BioY [bacterium (Candidatus Stahlbacteria)]|nr:biotin transporter BioY [Candidatus Stahlbacteria bacterium]